MSFVHLRVHSEYSLQDSTLKIKDMVAKAAELGMTHLALTDHHAMYGAFQFEKECKAKGITPIFGVEVLVDGYPLVVLAQSQDGYTNLVKLVTHANSVGKKDGVPGITKNAISEFAKGLVALSGGVPGEIGQLLLQGKTDQAQDVAESFGEMFGYDNFYLEVSDHGLPEEGTLMKLCYEISDLTDIPLVATNDVHYLVPEHAYARAVLNQLQGDVLPDWENHTTFSSEFHFATEKYMEDKFKGPVWGVAIANTEKIAKRCEGVEIPRERALPDFPVPEGHTLETLLKEKAWEGFHERFSTVEPDYKERLEYELGIINQMGFPAYFLIVSDFIRAAKEMGIAVGPGRGSAAGSLVAYCTGITDLDPIENNLLFERFLNPARVTMPDIDIDWCFVRRPEMIEYVQQKYGHDNVAQIVTFGTLGTKMIIRDIGRNLGLTYSETDEMSKELTGKESLEEAKALPYFQQKIAEDDRVAKLFEIGAILEGLPRHTSVHAAGVVIGRLPLQTYVPLKEEDGLMITQWDMVECEQVGLLKMDFLGLKTLTILEYAFDNIEETTGKRMTVKDIPWGDKKTYELLQAGKTGRVFQLESGGMQKVLRDLQPNNFEDIVAILALYRPGPMEFIPVYIENKEKGSFHVPHPVLEPILKVTNGIIVYQEQIQRIARDLCGYSLGEADLLRRAVSKKKREVLEEEREKFVTKGVAQGVDEKVANEVYDMIVRFAEYGFNRSHAAAYAVLTYWTAYLKAHFPIEFMASNLTVAIGDSEKMGSILSECKRMGIEVLNPKVGTSRVKFSCENGKIRFGLKGVRNVGSHLAEALESAPTLSSLEEYLKTIPAQTYNKRSWENLIGAGACDHFTNRGTHLLYLPMMLESAREIQDMRHLGQLSFFDMGVVPPVEMEKQPDPPALTMLKEEKRVLEAVLSGHPLDACVDLYAPFVSCSIVDLEQEDNGQKVTVAGIFTEVKQILTKKGQKMAFATLEDQAGDLEVVVFPKTFEQVSQWLKQMVPVLVTGRVEWDAKNERAKIIVDDIRPLVSGRQVLYVKTKNPRHAKQVTAHLASANGVTTVMFYDSSKKTLTEQPFKVRMNQDTLDTLSQEEYSVV